LVGIGSHKEMVRIFAEFDEHAQGTSTLRLK
jgi:hypothetical protein